MSRSSQPVALVTGGARRIGACIAEAFHTAGYNIVIHYNHSAGSAGELAASLNERRAGSIITEQKDLLDLEQISGLVKSCVQHYGRIDVLVNNASIFNPASFTEVTFESFTADIATHTIAPLALIHAFSNYVKTDDSPSIINITDIHTERPLEKYASYCLSKAALSALTRSMAIELAPKIRVNAVAPGAILWPEATSEMSEQAKLKLLANVPLGRLSEAEHVARSAVFLASNKSMTGQTLICDGGESI